MGMAKRAKRLPAVKNDPAVKAYYQWFSSEGGKARARKYRREQLREWARMGGRPRKKRGRRYAETGE
jgi:hypothetical protein